MTQTNVQLCVDHLNLFSSFYLVIGKRREGKVLRNADDRGFRF